METRPVADRETRRYLHRLRTVADESLPSKLRESAVRSLQAQMGETNPLKHVSAAALLRQVLRPWDERIYMRNGRGVALPVSRPQPLCLSDLW